jgi:hypothetical protein
VAICLQVERTFGTANLPLASAQRVNFALIFGWSAAGFQLIWTAVISDTTLKGEFGQPTFANFSGELATNGQSIAKGTYSGGFCSDAGFYGPKIKGTLTGSTIAPVNGIFTGTLNSSLYGPDVVTLTITQNPDFTLNFAGNSVENGVTTNLISGTTTRANYVIGAFVSLSGSAININGSETFTFNAHLNTNATQMTFAGMDLGMGTAAYETVTGSLTKQ